jgi:CheY-like chemotaxis protein
MSKKRILIVDDEVGAARLLGANLEATGNYQTRVENWPEDIVAVAREYRPDVILMDIIMPRMSGGDAIELLKADPVLGLIPVIFLTAAVQPWVVADHDGVICGRPCIAKPASTEEIIQCIEKQPPGNLPPQNPPPDRSSQSQPRST